MRVIAWNSQGAKWGTFWTNFIAPEIVTAQGNKEDLAGVLVEAGWAPFVVSGDVTDDKVYALGDGAKDWLVESADAFSVGVRAKRKRVGFWIPWVKTINQIKTNTRCSMGGTVVPYTSGIAAVYTIFPFGSGLILRPVVRVQLTRQNTVWMTILVVHLISGWWQKASEHMFKLIDTLSFLIPQGTPAMIVGDLNIDLQTVVFTLPPRWRLLRVGVATQQSGGELDFALLYDPNSHYPGASAAVVQPYKTALNPSDHSVLRYVVPDVT